MPISFKTLRLANIYRLPLFKNGKGEPAHFEPDGSDWSLGEWICAVTGELGELANVIKKVRRGDLSMAEARPAISKEIADVQIYLDILAMRCGVQLDEAVPAKFNEVSRRVGAPVFIDGDSVVSVDPVTPIKWVRTHEDDR